MEFNLKNAKDYHHYLDEPSLSMSDDEFFSDTFLKNPNALYKLLDYPQDITMSDFLLKKMANSQKKANVFLKIDLPEKSPRKASRSPTNPALKTFSTRKNIKVGGLKHLTVLIPEDGLLNRIEQNSQKKRFEKAHWEIVWEALIKNKKENQTKKHWKIRSQSFDEYLCCCDKFIHNSSYLFALKKTKKKV